MGGSRFQPRISLPDWPRIIWERRQVHIGIGVSNKQRLTESFVKTRELYPDLLWHPYLKWN